jgi:hypothetical protein
MVGTRVLEMAGTSAAILLQAHCNRKWAVQEKVRVHAGTTSSFHAIGHRQAKWRDGAFQVDAKSAEEKNSFPPTENM